ncbi:D-Tagatose 3-epimerase [hydrothermal vent metagenome]|uniref:D-Tagatose 3-epimerase n=1 Tax=hydrothermal vent metagenome TaxID=652676 RepID=A0A3B0TSY4_9ZZZZ
MKIGFCMLLWTTAVDDSHRPILEDIKATGYDGVEIPVMDGTPDEFAALGRMLDDIGLKRTAIAVLPTLEQNPLADDPATRKAAVDYLDWALECTQSLGAAQIAGPLHQTLGHFTGAPPSPRERELARDFHRAVGDLAAARGITVALEAINRFECYFANTMADICAHVAAVDHPAITAMYDTFHANIEEADPIAAYTSNAAHVTHVHISENDRGVPGRGHIAFARTLAAIKRSGYDGWLTIEAFGRGLPELAAATKVWRDFAESPEAVYREGFTTIREGWDKA